MQLSAVHENVELAILSSMIDYSQRTVFQLEASGGYTKKGRGAAEKRKRVDNTRVLGVQIPPPAPIKTTER